MENTYNRLEHCVILDGYKSTLTGPICSYQIIHLKKAVDEDQLINDSHLIPIN